MHMIIIVCLGTGESNVGGKPAMDHHSIQEGVEILLVALATETENKLWPDGPLGLYADFYLPFH